MIFSGEVKESLSSKKLYSSFLGARVYRPRHLPPSGAGADPAGYLRMPGK